MGNTKQTVVPFFRKYFLINTHFDTAIKRTELAIFRYNNTAFYTFLRVFSYFV